MIDNPYELIPGWLLLGYGAVTLLVYIWTGLALGATFHKMGEPRWKAWVPLVNLATVFSRGGVNPWLVLLGFFPVLGQIALLVLLIMAVQRINPGFGYGAGMTVLAVLVFPIWASILGFGPARWLGARGPLSAAHAASAPLSAPSAPSAAPAAPAFPGGIVAPPAPPVPPLPSVSPQVAAAAAPSAPAAQPSFAPFVPPAPPVVTAPPAADRPDPVSELFAPLSSVPGAPAPAAPAAAVPPAAALAPAPALPAAPAAPTAPEPEPAAEPSAYTPPAPALPDVAPWPTEIDDVSAIHPSPFPPSSASARPTVIPPVSEEGPIAFVPGRRAATTADQPDAVVTRVPAAPAPEVEPAFSPRSVRRADPDAFPELSGEVSAVVGAPSAGGPLSALDAVAAQQRAAEVDDATIVVRDGGDDALDQTVVVRRKRPTWDLVSASGAAVALTSDTVILGRRPVGDPAAPGAQLLAVADLGRTVSKTHALLQWREQAWQLSDLDSTNGVTVRSDLGDEVEVEGTVIIAPGVSFFLGDEEFRIEPHGQARRS